VVTGRVDHRDALRLYAGAVPDVDLTLCRLRAERDALTARIRRRGEGGGPALPGDELRGQPAEFLDRFADRAARMADTLDRADLDGACVDTTDLSAEEVAALVRARTAA
jgi:hypothetical protein